MLSTSWTLIAALCIFHTQRCSAELKFVQVVFRHGSTNPNPSTIVYPSDPYLRIKFKPFGPGALTDKGKLTNLNFGLGLLGKYGQFLGPTYSPSLIQFHANELNSIIMSAENVSSAMFSQTELKRSIPVKVEPGKTDVLYNGIKCSKYKKIRKNVEAHDPKLVKRRQLYKHIFSYLSENAGTNVTQIKSFYLNDILRSEWDIGLKLPSWAKVIVYILDDLATFDLIVQSYNSKMKKLMGGMWLREWLNHVEEFVGDKSKLKRKAHVYAAQQIHVAAILTALNVFDYILPDYNSAIMLELHEQNEKLYVKVIYKNKGVRQNLQIPGCNAELCPLEVFKKLVAPLVPDDPLKLCGEIEDNPF